MSAPYIKPQRKNWEIIFYFNYKLRITNYKCWNSQHQAMLDFCSYLLLNNAKRLAGFWVFVNSNSHQLYLEDKQKIAI
jgi:hypothetical protein